MSVGQTEQCFRESGRRSFAQTNVFNALVRSFTEANGDSIGFVVACTGNNISHSLTIFLLAFIQPIFFTEHGNLKIFGPISVRAIATEMPTAIFIGHSDNWGFWAA